MLSLKELEQAADKIRQALYPMPDGYEVQADEETGNILVKGPTLGFAVTANSIVDGVATQWAVDAFADLVKAEEQVGAAAKG